MCMGCSMVYWKARAIANCSLEGLKEEFIESYRKDSVGSSWEFSLDKALELWGDVVEEYNSFNSRENKNDMDSFMRIKILEYLKTEEEKEFFCKKHNITIKRTELENNYIKVEFINNKKEE